MTREQSWAHAVFTSLELCRDACERPPKIRLRWQHRFGGWRNWFTHHGWPGGWTYHVGPLKLCVEVYDYLAVMAPFRAHEDRMRSLEGRK